MVDPAPGRVGTEEKARMTIRTPEKHFPPSLGIPQNEETRSSDLLRTATAPQTSAPLPETTHEHAGRRIYRI